MSARSDSAPAVTVENSTEKGRPACLVVGFTGSGNDKLCYVTSTNGYQWSPTVSVGQYGFNGLAVLSPSAGKLDFAWAGALEGGYRHLNFLQT